MNVHAAGRKKQEKNSDVPQFVFISRPSAVTVQIMNEKLRWKQRRLREKKGSGSNAMAKQLSLHDLSPSMMLIPSIGFQAIDSAQDYDGD